MSDEPFGRQPKPVQITITSSDTLDSEAMAKDVFNLLFNRSGNVERYRDRSDDGTIHIDYYPRAVND